MEFRMVNKRQISCEIFIKVSERNRMYSRLLQAVARLKLHQKPLSRKWLHSLVQRRSFHLLRASQFFIPTIQTTIGQRIIFNIKYIKDRKSTFYNANIAFAKFCKSLNP